MSDYDLLHRIGRAIWGEHWQTSMAAAFDVRDRTVRYWLSGRYEVPADVWRELLARLEAKADDVSGAIAALKERVRR